MIAISQLVAAVGVILSRFCRLKIKQNTRALQRDLDTADQFRLEQMLQENG